MDETERNHDNIRLRGKLTGWLWPERPSVEAAVVADAEQYGVNHVSDCVLFRLIRLVNSEFFRRELLARQEFDLVTGRQHAEIQDERRRAFTSSVTTDFILSGVTVEELEQAADASPNEDVQLADSRDQRYHILLEEGQIEKCLVQRLVMSGHVCTLGLPWCDAAAHLPSLLAALPSPSGSPGGLRLQLLLYQHGYSIRPSEWQETLDALCNSASSGLLDGVALSFDFDSPVGPEELMTSPAFGALCDSLTYLGVSGDAPFCFDRVIQGTLQSFANGMDFKQHQHNKKRLEFYK